MNDSFDLVVILIFYKLRIAVECGGDMSELGQTCDRFDYTPRRRWSNAEIAIAYRCALFVVLASSNSIFEECEGLTGNLEKSTHTCFRLYTGKSVSIT